MTKAPNPKDQAKNTQPSKTREEAEATYSKENEQPTNANDAAAQWSLVSKHKQSTPNHLMWLGGCVLLVVMVMWLSGGNDQKATPKTNNNFSLDTGYQSELSANLDKLKSLQAKKPSPSPSMDDDINDDPTQAMIQAPAVDQKYLARQNAPTSMYTGGDNAGQINSNNNANSQGTRNAVLVSGGANSQFANQATTATSVQAKRIAHPNFTVAAGEMLHANLETAVNSDLPGMIRAVVSSPVYAYTGERTLIPKGSRLIGQYSSGIVQGQARIMAIWSRLILPNGITVQLDSLGTDQLGRSGMGADSIDRHFFARFGQATLLSLIGAGVASYGNNNPYNAASIYQAAIAQSFQQSAQQSLKQQMPQKPTLTFNQGHQINVFVAHDLSFYNALGGDNADDSNINPMPSFVH